MAMMHDSNGGGPKSAERDPRLDRLYSDTARETPPAHIDAAILAAARRAVGAGPRALSMRLRTWRVPVSIAAVVVLTASLVILVREEGGETLMLDAKPPAAAPSARLPEPAERSADPAPPSAAAATAPQRAPAATAEAFSARRDEATVKAAAEPGEMEKRARPSVGPTAVQGMRVVPAPEADDKALSRLFQEAPRPVEERAVAPQSPAADARRERAPAAAAQRSGPEPGAPAASPARPAPGRMQAEQAPAMKRAPVWHGLEQEPPQKWLERALELKRQGRTAEAEELLAEFKRRFPDHRLPAELE